MTHFYFRVDYNNKIGFGHLARCSYLANYIENYFGHKATFITLETNGELPSYFKVSNLSKIKASDVFADVSETIKLISKDDGEKILVVDSYQIDEVWERQLKPYVKKLVVIDDLANRNHVCDYLLDCGFQRSKSDYSNKVNPETILLLGLDYCLLPLDIISIQNKSPQKNRAHLFFGGAVSFDDLLKYYLEIKREIPQINFNIAYPYQMTKLQLKQWETVKAIEDFMFCSQPIVGSLKGCSIAIGSPGIAVWERAYLGIPGLYVSVSTNQIQVLKQLESLNFCFYLCPAEEISKNIFKIKEALISERLIMMSRALNGMIDGQGNQRVAKEVLSEFK